MNVQYVADNSSSLVSITKDTKYGDENGNPEAWPLMYLTVR